MKERALFRGAKFSKGVEVSLHFSTGTPLPKPDSGIGSVWGSTPPTAPAPLLQLKSTLDVYFERLPQEQFIAWRKAKGAVAFGETETPGDVTVGKNLPQAPTRLVGNNIGGALPL